MQNRFASSAAAFRSATRSRYTHRTSTVSVRPAKAQLSCRSLHCVRVSTPSPAARRFLSVLQCTRHTPCTPYRPYRSIITGPSSTSFADPTRGDLFYHLVEPPTPVSSEEPAFALSFLSTPPPSAESATIIGFLPATSHGPDQEAGLNDFRENPKFRTILHEAIRAGLSEGVDDIWTNGATQTQQGWMHIHDDRNVPALGRIGDPDDIFASVRVEDGKILSETYQSMPSYRLCTADGLITLTEGLAQKLKTLLEQRDLAERSAGH
ncbi:hypothetical protein PLICRDRAFT_105407 [Plicaturopsis crispa FD-325 SS-3]|nr:hypothetical protein PLICRDRAFT_105407 [Plicaturopsis crispa FD-325 SS-3]